MEKTAGRTEYVMYDHQEPGAIVRFWMTFASGGHDGILRIYIDGASEPAIEGNVLEILSGQKLAGKPLSSSSSEDSKYLQRGHNLYLPIPYAESCKVTIETDALQGDLDEWSFVGGPKVYYNINYREYPEGVVVKPFSLTDLRQNQKLIDNVNKTLALAASPQGLDSKSCSRTIGPDETAAIGINGAKAIRKLTLKLNAQDLSQALRSTVLAIKFDGKETVWAPIGDFFGTGYKISPYKTWYTEVTSDGTMSCSWIMPFQGSSEVRLINLGDQDVEALATVDIQSHEWTDDTLYFHSSWFEKHRFKTLALDFPGRGASDVNFVTIKGKGVYVGDALTVFNAAGGKEGIPWWGEGDEKIFVDGERFPSHFGTGTEDYYGYAWCRPEKFRTPFIAQPDGSGNLAPGFTVNSRHRLLDVIPFTTSLKVDVELWHWQETIINYAPTVYYYATKASRSNSVRDRDNAKKKVTLKPSDLNPPVMENGKIEGEAMEVVSVTHGDAAPQSLDGWSDGSQLWWTGAGNNAELTLRCIGKKARQGGVELTYTIASDYGIFDVYLNGELIDEDLDLYSPTLGTKAVAYRNVSIQKGSNLLKAVQKGSNPRAEPKMMFGIDLLRVID